MDKTIKRVTNLTEQQQETYRYWRSRPMSERFLAIWELSRDAYALKAAYDGTPAAPEGSTRRLIRRVLKPEAGES